jgi:hypothetical protein
LVARAISLAIKITDLKKSFGKKGEREVLRLLADDVPDTDASELVRAVAFQPATSVEVGVPRFFDG